MELKELEHPLDKHQIILLFFNGKLASDTLQTQLIDGVDHPL